MTVPDLPAATAEPTVNHGGHFASAFEAFHWSFLAVSVRLVDGVGGLVCRCDGTQYSRP